MEIIINDVVKLLNETNDNNYFIKNMISKYLNKNF